MIKKLKCFIRWLDSFGCKLDDHKWGPRDWQQIKAELNDTGNAGVSECKRCGKIV